MQKLKLQDIIREGFIKEDEIIGNYDIYEKGSEIIYFDPSNEEGIRFDLKKELKQVK